MNFHHNSVAETIRVGSLCTNLFKQQDYVGQASRPYRSPITDYQSLNSYVAPNCYPDP
jgi:hypothetical protein